MADEGFDLPTDAFVGILVRLPMSARRRFRLVCKRWRDIIDKRTAERHVRTKILVFKSKPQSSSVLVFDDEDGRLRHEWTYDSAFCGKVDMVGTCNGLICLHEFDAGDRSTITVANPITGEALPLPPVPETWDSFRRFGMYGFGYHPTTGQYKAVHVPSRLARRLDAVHVLTLGDSAWREVAAPAMGGSYNSLRGGVVSVDGSAYWFTTSLADRVMALDLKDECVTSFPGPPPAVQSVGVVVGEASWKLTSVNARLGVVFPSYEPATRVEVWVLEDGGVEQPRWSRRYTLIDRTVASWIVMTPHLTHGEYILTMSLDMKRLYRHKVGDCTDVGEGTTSQLLLSEGTELVMSKEEGAEDRLTIYAYAETREPLPRARAIRQFLPIGFYNIK